MDKGVKDGKFCRNTPTHVRGILQTDKMKYSMWLHRKKNVNLTLPSHNFVLQFHLIRLYISKLHN